MRIVMELHQQQAENQRAAAYRRMRESMMASKPWFNDGKPTIDGTCRRIEEPLYIGVDLAAPDESA